MADAAESEVETQQTAVSGQTQEHDPNRKATSFHSRHLQHISFLREKRVHAEEKQMRDKERQTLLRQSLRMKSFRGPRLVNLECDCCGGGGGNPQRITNEAQTEVSTEDSASALDTTCPAPPAPPPVYNEKDWRRTCRQSMRLRQNATLQNIREKRDFENAKRQRQQLEKESRLRRAQQLVLGNSKDEKIRTWALARAQAQPDFPDLQKPLQRYASAQLPPIPRLIAGGPTSFAELAPKIDVHQHCMPGDESGLMEMLETNSTWAVRKSVLLSLRLPKSNRDDVRARNDWVLAMAEKHPMVIPFVTVIEDDDHAPRMFSECIDRGAKGLKLIGWHSNYIKQFDYDLRHPALMEVFQIAAERCVPVLTHLWVGYRETKRDYVKDLDAILTQLPTLKFVLAHFGLGFDPETLPAVDNLATKHKNLYIDTSLYGSFCELWFSRASNQSVPLREFVRAHPRQVLFGSDVFGSRRKRSSEYADALRASVAFVERSIFSCVEFTGSSSYFKETKEDKYGLVEFDPLRIRGLGLGDDAELLKLILQDNAEELLSGT